MLQKADFERHGFQKEESRTLLSAGKFPAYISLYDQHLLLQGGELLPSTSDAGFNGGRETTSR